MSQHKRQRGGDEIKARFWALTTRDSTGDELSLYHRRHPGPGRGLKQGTNNFYMLKHGNCTRSIDKSDLCMSDVTQEDKDIFRGAISRIKNGNFRYFNERVKGSELIDFFDNMVGIEDEDSADDSPNFVKDMAGELASKDSKHEIVLNLEGNLRGTQADSKATDNKDVKDIEKLDTKNKNASKNGKEEKGKMYHFYYVFHKRHSVMKTLTCIIPMSLSCNCNPPQWCSQGGQKDGQEEGYNQDHQFP